MVNFPGRNGRRRRVLNEEVLSASSSHAVLRAVPKDDSTRAVPRYSEAAGVENHAQITDFIPRRYRSIALLTATGCVATASLAALHYFAAPIARLAGVGEIAAFDFTAAGSMASWVMSVVLLAASIGCLVVYSIRRHRIDDFRGRYRIWRAAAVACAALSANSVVGFHNVLANTMTHLSGWTALRGGAIWWLIPFGLPLTWIVARATLDVKESRLAGFLLATSMGCYIVAGVTTLHALSITDARIESAVGGASLLAGHWFALAAIVSYARFVVLDAQGLVASQPRITSKRKSQKPAKLNAATTGTTTASGPSTLSAADFARRKQQLAQSVTSPASSSQWVDGSHPERDRYDDGDDDDSGDERKLSKSDRKRLRKLKMQNRAA